MEEDRITWNDIETLVKRIGDSIYELESSIDKMTKEQRKAFSGYYQLFEKALEASESFQDYIEEMEECDEQEEMEESHV